jgi:hypothetical protein
VPPVKHTLGVPAEAPVRISALTTRPRTSVRLNGPLTPVLTATTTGLTYSWTRSLATSSGTRTTDARQRRCDASATIS